MELFAPKADLALGTISNLEARASAALAPVYDEAHPAAQKAPWANFTSWKDLGGQEGKLGTAALECEPEVMDHWHRFKEGEITRRTLREYLRPIQKRSRKILRRGNRPPLIAGTSKELLEYWTCLWVFTKVYGIEPTNNAGERDIRPAVLWRKGSFGSHSEEGSPFVKRMLTVARSQRKQGRAVLEFLVGAFLAHRRGRRAPSLLPDPGG